MWCFGPAGPLAGWGHDDGLSDLHLSDLAEKDGHKEATALGVYPGDAVVRYCPNARLPPWKQVRLSRGHNLGCLHGQLMWEHGKPLIVPDGGERSRTIR